MHSAAGAKWNGRLACDKAAQQPPACCRRLVAVPAGLRPRGGRACRLVGVPTLISLAGGQETHVVVEESAEEVRKLIREARAEGLVRLTAGQEGHSVWINPAYVILVRSESPE